MTMTVARTFRTSERSGAAPTLRVPAFEYGPHCVDRIGVRGTLVFAIPFHACESQGHAARVVRARLKLVEGDLDDQVRAHVHNVPLAPGFEFEQPPETEGETLEAYYPRVGRFMEDLPAYEGLAELCAAAAHEFRQISGFNRILIYRFDDEWNGEVLAEDVEAVA